MSAGAGTGSASATARRVAYPWTFVLRAALWSAVTVTLASAAPAEGRLAVGAWMGEFISRTHSIPAHLGIETFATGASGGYVGWLGAIATFFVMRLPHASSWIAVLGVLATLTALLVVERRAGGAEREFVGVAAVALTALCMLDSLRPGNGAVDWLFAAALFAALEQSSPRGLLNVFLIAIFWCNVSADGILAALFAGTVAVAGYFEAPGSAETRRLWFSFGGTVAAALITPAFLTYPSVALRTLFGSTGAALAAAPSALAPNGYRAGLVIVVLVAVSFARLRRPRDCAVLIVALVCALSNGTLLPIFGIAGAPLVARSLRFGASGARERALLRAATATAAAAAVAFMFLVLRPAGDRPPVVTESLGADGRPHRLFCERPEWCSLVVAENRSIVQVFVDDRMGQYADEALKVQLEVVRARPGWKNALLERHVSDVVTMHDSSLGSLLELDPRWSRIASSADTSLFERRRLRP